MANDQHLTLLEQGAAVWNLWRQGRGKGVTPDLSGADLYDMSLTGVDLAGADLSNANLALATLDRAGLTRANLAGADLSGASLERADLSGANLQGADLFQAQMAGAVLAGAEATGANFSHAALVAADLQGAILDRAYLSEADLTGAVLYRASLVKATLFEADLTAAQLLDADLSGADLHSCRVFGVSAWRVELRGAKQENLLITSEYEPKITVDNLAVAQLLYLLLYDENVPQVLNTINRKAVLLLGGFKEGGLDLLNEIAATLREKDYLPIIFSFGRPEGRDYTETINTLAGLARFVIADLGGPSVPAELSSAAGNFEIPFVLIAREGLEPYPLVKDLLAKDHVIKPILYYADEEDLLARLVREVIEPAEAKAREREAKLKAIADTDASLRPPGGQ